MDGGVGVFLDQPLRYEDGILEVVSVPRHEGHQHVAAQGQFSHVGGRPVGQHVAALDLVADLDQRSLVDGGVLVRTRVLDQVVDVHARLTGPRLVVVDPHHDAAGIHRIHATAAAGHDGDAGVHGHDALHAGADQRFLALDRGHGLPLHVGAHERAVGVVVLEERDERCRHRNDLRRGNVDVIDLVRRRQRELVLVPAGHQFVHQLAALVHRGIRLGDHEVAFLDGGQVLDRVRDLCVLHLAIRRLQETVIVGARVTCQGVDEPDIGALRGLDGAHATVVCRVYVSHLEPGTLPGEPAGAQRRNPALVGDLRQGIGLVHELGQLAGAEELLHHRGNRLRVDQLLRREVLRLRHAQSLADGAFHAHQADPELVLDQLTD